MWYNAGTITVAAGSVDVVGNGTAFVGNVDTSHALIAADGRIYEIAQVVSATALKLVRPYAGGGAANVAYDILPTQVNLAGMTIRLDELLATFRVVRDTIGQGMFPDGTVATPAIRFTADQDTGLRRFSNNGIALVTGGSDAVAIDQRVRVLRPIEVQQDNGYIGVDDGPTSRIAMIKRPGSPPLLAIGAGLHFNVAVSSASRIQDPANEQFTILLRVSSAGYLRVGSSTAPDNTHRFIAQGGEGTPLGAFDLGNDTSAFFNGVSGRAWSSASSCLFIGRHSGTNRSINAAGTLNASGADYAEYMVKATGCGIIAKGDVCGVDHDGKLTKTWADAISFVIKSTDPSLVGGDTWDADVGPKPDEPGAAPVEPSPPAPPAEDTDDATIAAWRDATAAYPAQVASYQTAQAEWQKAMDAYAKALPIWEAAHEKARQCVDRIAFCGQVPVNVSGDFEVGDYIIAAASGAGIKAVAVKADDMTLPQYMRRIGKVWAIRDGRPWVDVQHG